MEATTFEAVGISDKLTTWTARDKEKRGCVLYNLPCRKSRVPAVCFSGPGPLVRVRAIGHAVRMSYIGIRVAWAFPPYMQAKNES